MDVNPVFKKNLTGILLSLLPIAWRLLRRIRSRRIHLRYQAQADTSAVSSTGGCICGINDRQMHMRYRSQMNAFAVSFTYGYAQVREFHLIILGKQHQRFFTHAIQPDRKGCRILNVEYANGVFLDIGERIGFTGFQGNG